MVLVIKQFQKFYICQVHIFLDMVNILKNIRWMNIILTLLTIQTRHTSLGCCMLMDVILGKSISISLKSEDKHILEKINKLIGSNRKLKLIPYHQKNEKWSDQYSLCITNKYMATQLMNLGVVPHKKFNIDLSRLAIRGFIS